MVLLCLLLCCFSTSPRLWGDKKTLCGDSPHTLPMALHLCWTTAQALSPKWKKSCRIFCLYQKQSAFLSFMFGSSLAGIFQKIGGSEMMMCVNVFRLYLRVFNVSQNPRHNQETTVWLSKAVPWDLSAVRAKDKGWSAVLLKICWCEFWLQLFLRNIVFIYVWFMKTHTHLTHGLASWQCTRWFFIPL